MLYLVYLLYTTVTYCLHHCCCCCWYCFCCSPPREQKQRQQLLQQLISACPGVRATLIIRSTLQHTRHYSCIILPSSVFTPARPDRSQNPQRRRRTASLLLELAAWSKCLWPPQSASASNAHHAAPRRTTAKAASERALPEPLLSTRAFPITPKYTRAQRQGQGALSLLVVAHLPASPSRCCLLSHRFPPPPPAR